MKKEHGKSRALFLFTLRQQPMVTLAVRGEGEQISAEGSLHFHADAVTIGIFKGGKTVFKIHPQQGQETLEIAGIYNHIQFFAVQQLGGLDQLFQGGKLGLQRIHRLVFLNPLIQMGGILAEIQDAVLIVRQPVFNHAHIQIFIKKFRASVDIPLQGICP